jgi:hypothetical protein
MPASARRVYEAASSVAHLYINLGSPPEIDPSNGDGVLRETPPHRKRVIPSHIFVASSLSGVYCCVSYRAGAVGEQSTPTLLDISPLLLTPAPSSSCLPPLPGMHDFLFFSFLDSCFLSCSCNIWLDWYRPRGILALMMLYSSRDWQILEFLCLRNHPPKNHVLFMSKSCFSLYCYSATIKYEQ